MADTYIIAEIGTAHQGDASRARELISAARESGADCAKFQYVIADEIVHPSTGRVALPGGSIPLYERFRALEQPAEFYAGLQAACTAEGVDFLCTPFGLESARSLRALEPRALKIASPELNHTALLNELSGYHLPLIVSTDVSTLADIEYALSILDRESVTLLHCITAYPAPEEEYNLRLIPTLSHVFGVPVGLSDHSEEPNLVPGLAVALGATVVEKHFTLSREGDGLDDPIAMDPVMFTQMSATIRRIDAIRSLDREHGGARVIAEFEQEYGSARVRVVLGDGVKRLAAREAGYYRTTRRSLRAARDVERGDVFEARDLLALRSETLEPGLEPRWADLVVGARASRPVRAGAPITWDCLLDAPESRLKP
ncbi:MAG: N-acetylneuraminate synthase family protein [Spirochaetota bacterium]